LIFIILKKVKFSQKKMKLSFYKQLNNNTFAPIFEKRLESNKKWQNKAIFELDRDIEKSIYILSLF